MTVRWIALLATALCGAFALPAAANAQSLSPDEARAIAKDAYVYGFPIVDSYRIQYAYFVDRKNPEFKAPWNEIHHEARVYSPADKAVQTPNADTPYSQLGVDLRAEPLVLTFPDIEKRRYYSAQFIDMYTFNFAYVGSRATGNGAGSFLLAGPSWKGDTPAGIKSVIRSETDFAFVLYRTQLFGAGDLENVEKIQAGYKVQTLSQFSGKPAAPAAPTVAFPVPLTAEQERTSLAYFDELNFLLQFCPTHRSEEDLMARFAKLGIGAGKHFGAESLAPEIKKAVEDGRAEAWQSLEVLQQKQGRQVVNKVTSDDVFGSRQRLQNNYLYRMLGTVVGIYGDSREEALHPAYHTDSAGRKLDGSYRYALRFAPDLLPPVNAFWSLTMYELPSQLLAANPLDRYLINSSMVPSLKREPDGGITLYVQHESPGADQAANWLPAPQGPFFLVLRMYLPQPAAIEDHPWRLPKLKRVGGSR